MNEVTEYELPEAPSWKDFSKWLLKTDDTDATELLNGENGVTQNLEVYATYYNVSAFVGYGTALNAETYGTKYSLTTGGETIKVDINNTPNNVKDDVAVEDDWVIFYEDSIYLYLIYRDYYPVANQTKNGISNMSFAESTAKFPYAIYADEKTNENRAMLLKYLRNRSGYSWYVGNAFYDGTEYLSWSKLKESISKLSKMKGKKIYVQGAPDLELWISSWNAKGNTNLKHKTEPYGKNIMLNTNDATNDVYCINVITDSAYNTTANEENKTGYYDELYFPYRTYTEGDGTSGNAYGYWLASPGGRSNNKEDMFGVRFNGYIYGFLDCDSKNMCARPVVAIKK